MKNYKVKAVEEKRFITYEKLMLEPPRYSMNKVILENTVLALLKASPGLGSIHQNKGLLIIDAYYHSLFGKTLTGINYVKHDLGPVPDPDAYKIIYAMEFEKVEVRPEKKGTCIQNSHYAIVEPDYAVFPPEAVEIIEEVAKMIEPFSATKLSNLTHNAAWKHAKKGEVIPIESAYSIEVVDGTVRELSDEEEAEFDRELEDLYADNGFEIHGACF
jgi:hypothetical protein